MTIRGLEEWLAEKGLIKTEPLSSLSNLHVGVDGHNVLRTLRCNEVNQVATGGVPITLKRSILAEAEHYKTHHITSTWVFNGIKTQTVDMLRTIDPRAQKRDAGWDAYQAGRAEEASSSFQASLPTDKSLASFFAPQAMSYLEEGGHAAFAAPMMSWPQLAHWMDPDLAPQMGPVARPLIHAIYGPTELLLYGARFLILSMDWAAGTFSYVEYTQVLKASGLSGERFFEACVLAGFDGVSSTMLPSTSIPSSTSTLPSDHFKAYLEARSPAASDIISLLGGPDSPKLTYYRKSAALVRLYLILDLKGETRPYQRELQSQIQITKSPALEIKFPETAYWLMGNGAISSQVLSAFLSGALLETTPLADSASYRKLLNDLVDMRARSIALLAQTMPSEIASKTVVSYRWYEPSQAVPINHFHFKTFAKTCGARSFIPSIEIDEEIRKQNLLPLPASPAAILPHITLPFVLSAIENGPKSYNAPMPMPSMINAPREIQATTLALALELYQYVGSRSLTDLGKALKLASPIHSSEAFIFLELLRNGHIHGQPLHPSTPAADNDPELSLISRVFSLISMDLTEKWAGPIDRELMAFNSLVRAVYRTARNVVEMSLYSITQAGRLTVPTEYPNISRHMPFFQESNTALGVVVSSFLLEETPDFNQRFAKIPSVKQDLLRGFSLWKDLQKIVEQLQASKAMAIKVILTPEFLSAFQAASERLATAFASFQ
jgi:hypothetical protein